MAEQHVFLSDGWIEAAKAAYERHDVSVPYKMKMNQVITGCPFEPNEVRTFIDTSDGTMRTGKGELDGADVTLHTDWETSRKIIVEQDQTAAMQAFMSGKIKVVGDMTKIMAMNATPPTPAQLAVAEDIKNLTA
ncbi:MAG: SCP2 sterol-binding domain-containing protein [Ilumatobacteraceae bacterium]